VRELRNVVERSVYRMADFRKPVAEVLLDPFGAAVAAAPAVSPQPPLPAPEAGLFRDRVDGFEKQLLTEALAAARFNQKQAAAALGLSYHQFRNALKKHAL
jgi:psp operon transcriptional activator